MQYPDVEDTVNAGSSKYSSTMMFCDIRCTSANLMISFTGSSLLLLPFFGYGWAVLAKVESMPTPVCSLSVLAAAAAAAISCNALLLPALSSPSSESPVQRALWLVCPEAQDLVRGAEAAPDVPAAFNCSWLLLLPLPQLPPLQLPRRRLYAAASCDCYLQRSACVSLRHH
jgi:hypothetical protein